VMPKRVTGMCKTEKCGTNMEVGKRHMAIDLFFVTGNTSTNSGNRKGKKTRVGKLS